MKKYLFVFALAVLSVAVWVASASAVSKPPTFSLLAVDNGKGQPINGFLGDRAPVAGEQFAISDDLYKWAGTKRGAKVGSDQGIATFLSVTAKGGSNTFTVQANLSGGTVLVGGIISYKNENPSKFTLAITGGTGKYAGTHGYVDVHALPNNKNNLDFHLLP